MTTHVRRVAAWTLLAIPAAILTGCASAGFLFALDAVTRLRFREPWLLFLLPLAGAAMVVAYARWGHRSDGGNKLLIEEIHTPGGGVPARMAPFVLGATLVTHLFGGSAGREGTAVQMGGSIAAECARRWRAKPATVRVLLMAGISAGFGAVFGTPWAGAVFAIEVLALQRLEFDAIVPVVVSGLLANFVCEAWGVHHVAYAIAPASLSVLPRLSLLAKAAGVGVGFGLASLLFVRLDHAVRSAGKSIRQVWLRPVLGAVLVILLVWVLRTSDYLGLGVLAEHPGSVTLVSAFQADGATPWSWLWKIVFTAVTLGSGFKGGEVTPLFYIGATLGNALAGPMGMPFDLCAGLGLIAVFGAAARTPLACIILGIELFGGHFAPEFAVACLAAYLVSGKQGIYHVPRPLPSAQA